MLGPRASREVRRSLRPCPVRLRRAFDGRPPRCGRAAAGLPKGRDHGLGTRHRTRRAAARAASSRSAKRQQRGSRGPGSHSGGTSRHAGCADEAVDGLGPRTAVEIVAAVVLEDDQAALRRQEPVAILRAPRRRRSRRTRSRGARTTSAEPSARPVAVWPPRIGAGAARSGHAHDRAAGGDVAPAGRGAAPSTVTRRPRSWTRDSMARGTFRFAVEGGRDPAGLAGITRAERKVGHEQRG